MSPPCAAGGRGGPSVFPPRMLSGLQLQRRTLGHLSAVYCLVFECSGRYVITGADDLLVKVRSDGGHRCGERNILSFKEAPFVRLTRVYETF